MFVSENTNGQRIEPRHEAGEPPDEQGQGPIYKANDDGLVPRSNDIPILFELHAGEIQPALLQSESRRALPGRSTLPIPVARTQLE